jgi:hypothetical protein
MMVEELIRAKMLPDAKADIVEVDVERFVERHLKVPLDQHAPLEGHVLGVTRFEAGKPPKIEINSDLTGSALDEEDATPGLVGRWRATVAHEAAHVLLHRCLFELDDPRRGTFAFTREQPGQGRKLMRCLKRDVASRRGSDWREVQANMGMAALLMPKPVVVQVVRQERERMGLQDGPVVDGSAEHRTLTGELARRFTVSQQVARIRIEVLGITGVSGQAQL